MLSSLVLPALSTLLLSLPSTSAQGSDGTSYYTVWSSVIFTRTGDRTPVYLNNEEAVLTTLGAAQAYEAGAFMRSRYTGADSVDGNSSAPLQGLSINGINVEQMFIGAPAEQFTIATAQAFMQGLYPPFNSTSTLANATQIASPLGGYQYPMIQTYSNNDPESIFLNAQSNCEAFQAYVDNWMTMPSTIDQLDNNWDLYQKVGDAMLEGVLPSENWNYQYAWAIWDYVNYQVTHFSNASQLFEEGGKLYDETGNTNYLDLLQQYAVQQMNGLLGNLTTSNPVQPSLPFSATTGTISTIAGNFLASQILGQLQQAIRYKSEYYKLSLLFGDFQPMKSLFTILQLPSQTSMFAGIPDFASMIVFELYSLTDGGSNVPFPENEEDLYVRTSFRDGTGSELQGYSLFGLDADQFDLYTIDLPWNEFSNLMYSLVPGNASNWCQQCNSDSIFCAYSNASDSLGAGALLSASQPPVSPVLAGVIGALVSLVFAIILFALLMLVTGLRFHRVYSRKNSEIGGYKGSRKLASDKDLVIPKGGVASVITTEERAENGGGGAVRGGHERVGSWELKQNNTTSSPDLPHYQHHDEHDIGEAPWKAVVPEERV